MNFHSLTLIEKTMLSLYISLSEKDRRHYAAVTALQQRKHGIKYSSELFSCDPKTVQRGIKEIKSGFFCPKDKSE